MFSKLSLIFMCFFHGGGEKIHLLNYIKYPGERQEASHGQSLDGDREAPVLDELCQPRAAAGGRSLRLAVNRMVWEAE